MEALFEALDDLVFMAPSDCIGILYHQFNKAIDPIVSDPAIDGVVIDFWH